jgi:uncharacterized protein YjbI with pentapeptide repeats
VSRYSGWTVLALVGLVSVFVYGYVARPGWMGVADKTLWDWMQLLIVPLLLAGGGFLLNSNAQLRHAELVEEAQRERDEEAAIRRAQNEALRAYIDQMSRLIAEGHLIEGSEDSYFRRLAQASTLQTLVSMDMDRKRLLLTLIYELDLISKDDPIISLKNAALDTADLSEITLHDACLEEADLRRANLMGANLKGSDLTRADLRGANLNDTDLSNTVFAGANLLPYDPRAPAEWSVTKLLSGLADSSDVDISDDYLVPTNLGDANLSGADLSGAYLTGTKVAPEQLAACKSLEGATMPDGQKYEDWLKSKNQEENKKSDGSS